MPGQVKETDKTPSYKIHYQYIYTCIYIYCDTIPRYGKSILLVIMHIPSFMLGK